MHYYNFNIEDYKAHTDYLDLMEDLAYRRLLDWCYLHEKPLPNDVDEIAKRIRMRSHEDSIANVLRDFFELTDEGYINKRATDEVEKYKAKEENARKSAEARWNKKKSNANAMQAQSERKSKAERKQFIPPSPVEVQMYCQEKGYNIDAESFCDFYDSKGWMVGKNKMKDWKAAVRTWVKRGNNNANQQQKGRTQQVSDELDRIAQESMRKEGLI